MPTRVRQLNESEYSKAEMDAVMSQKKVPFQEVHNKFVMTSLQVHLPKKTTFFLGHFVRNY